MAGRERCAEKLGYISDRVHCVSFLKKGLHSLPWYMVTSYNIPSQESLSSTHTHTHTHTHTYTHTHTHARAHKYSPNRQGCNSKLKLSGEKKIQLENNFKLDTSCFQLHAQTFATIMCQKTKLFWTCFCKKGSSSHTKIYTLYFFMHFLPWNV